MASSFRIGVIGLTHDHIWSNLEELADTRRGELVAAADSHQPLLDKIKELHGCPTYQNPEQMLDSEQLDAVYLYSDNATGALHAIEAARRGLHMLVEKPMASTLEGANEMIAAVRRADVRLMINWPFAWWPQLQHALKMAHSGELGDVWQVRYRAAHAGPKELGCSPYFCEWLFDEELNGGGALIDYCSYGAALARELLGVPSRVTGVAGRLCKEEFTVEDNAVIVMTYARAMATAEASWTQIGNLSSYVPVIYGTRATLMVEPRTGGKLLLATTENPDGTEVDVPPLAEHLSTASAHFLWALETGEEFLPLCSDRVARDAQEILEAGLISSDTGEAVSLPLRASE